MQFKEVTDEQGERTIRYDFSIDMTNWVTNENTDRQTVIEQVVTHKQLSQSYKYMRTVDLQTGKVIAPIETLH